MFNGNELRVIVPILCDKLVDNKCSIYETKMDTCKNFRYEKNMLNDSL